jgi:hypothetical protein
LLNGTVGPVESGLRQVEELRQFNDTCLDMAEVCQLNGDDQSYLHAMGKLHHH